MKVFILLLHSSCIAPDSLIRTRCLPEEGCVGSVIDGCSWEDAGGVAVHCVPLTSASTLSRLVFDSPLLVSSLLVAATPDEGSRDGSRSQEEEDEEVLTAGAVASAVVNVIPADLAPLLLNLLIGSNQCPERAFLIWK